MNLSLNQWGLMTQQTGKGKHTYRTFRWLEENGKSSNIRKHSWFWYSKSPQEPGIPIIYGHLVFDVDHENLLYAGKRTVALLNYIEEAYEVPVNDLKYVQVFASGGKGYHILIHKDILDLKPSPYYNDTMKLIAAKLWEATQIPQEPNWAIDNGVYNGGGGNTGYIPNVDKEKPNQAQSRQLLVSLAPLYADSNARNQKTFANKYRDLVSKDIKSETMIDQYLTDPTSFYSHDNRIQHQKNPFPDDFFDLRQLAQAADIAISKRWQSLDNSRMSDEESSERTSLLNDMKDLPPCYHILTSKRVRQKTTNSVFMTLATILARLEDRPQNQTQGVELVREFLQTRDKAKAKGSNYVTAAMREFRSIRQTATNNYSGKYTFDCGHIRSTVSYAVSPASPKSMCEGCFIEENRPSLSEEDKEQAYKSYIESAPFSLALTGNEYRLHLKDSEPFDAEDSTLLFSGISGIKVEAMVEEETGEAKTALLTLSPLGGVDSELQIPYDQLVTSNGCNALDVYCIRKIVDSGFTTSVQWIRDKNREYDGKQIGRALDKHVGADGNIIMVVDKLGIVTNLKTQNSGYCGYDNSFSYTRLSGDKPIRNNYRLRQRVKESGGLDSLAQVLPTPDEAIRHHLGLAPSLSRPGTRSVGISEITEYLKNFILHNEKDITSTALSWVCSGVMKPIFMQYQGTGFIPNLYVPGLLLPGTTMIGKSELSTQLIALSGSTNYYSRLTLAEGSSESEASHRATIVTTSGVTVLFDELNVERQSVVENLKNYIDGGFIKNQGHKDTGVVRERIACPVIAAGEVVQGVAALRNRSITLELSTDVDRSKTLDSYEYITERRHTAAPLINNLLIVELLRGKPGGIARNDGHILNGIKSLHDAAKADVDQFVQAQDRLKLDSRAVNNVVVPLMGLELLKRAVTRLGACDFDWESVSRQTVKRALNLQSGEKKTTESGEVKVEYVRNVEIIGGFKLLLEVFKTHQLERKKHEANQYKTILSGNTIPECMGFSVNGDTEKLGIDYQKLHSYIKNARIPSLDGDVATSSPSQVKGAITSAMRFHMEISREPNYLVWMDIEALGEVLKDYGWGTRNIINEVKLWSDRAEHHWVGWDVAHADGASKRGRRADVKNSYMPDDEDIPERF